MDIAKFLNTLILKKNCEWLLLNNVQRNYSSMKTKLDVKCFSTFTGKHLYRSALFIKYSCSRQLKPIFIQIDVLALVFSWQLSEIFNNFFLKSIFKRKKKHCYEKRGTDIYHKSNYAIFTSPRFLYFSTFLSDNGLVSLVEKITKSSK